MPYFDAHHAQYLCQPPKFGLPPHGLLSIPNSEITNGIVRFAGMSCCRYLPKAHTSASLGQAVAPGLLTHHFRYRPVIHPSPVELSKQLAS